MCYRVNNTMLSPGEDRGRPCHSAIQPPVGKRIRIIEGKAIGRPCCLIPFVNSTVQIFLTLFLFWQTMSLGMEISITIHNCTIIAVQIVF